MNITAQLDAVVSRHDLLQHPFYQAWTAGILTADDLKRYAQEYYHHVSAFPTYISSLHSRLPDGALRRAVLRNLAEEEIAGPAHSDLWLDFAEGMGAHRNEARNRPVSAGMQQLIWKFRSVAAQRPPAAVMGAFYAYESQVARIAGTKADTLQQRYGADAKTCAYFKLHSTQDTHHARVWSEWIGRELDGGSPVSEVLATVDEAATALWDSLSALS